MAIWASNEVPTSSKFNSYISPVGARVYNNAGISIATSGVTQTLTFNSERFDTDTCHSTSVNTSRLTCTTAGTYLIGGSVAFAGNATGIRQIQINYNTSTVIAVLNVPADPGAAVIFLSIQTIYQLAATDFVELAVNQTSGGALNVGSNANYSPEFYMWRIGP